MKTFHFKMYGLILLLLLKVIFSQERIHDINSDDYEPQINSLIEQLNWDAEQIYDYQFVRFVNGENKGDITDLTIEVQLNCRIPDECQKKLMTCTATLQYDSKINTFQTLPDISCDENTESFPNDHEIIEEALNHLQAQQKNIDIEDGDIEVINPDLPTEMCKIMYKDGKVIGNNCTADSIKYNEMSAEEQHVVYNLTMYALNGLDLDAILLEIVDLKRFDTYYELIAKIATSNDDKLFCKVQIGIQESRVLNCENGLKRVVRNLMNKPDTEPSLMAQTLANEILVGLKKNGTEKTLIDILSFTAQRSRRGEKMFRYQLKMLLESGETIQECTYRIDDPYLGTEIFLEEICTNEDITAITTTTKRLHEKMSCQNE